MKQLKPGKKGALRLAMASVAVAAGSLSLGSAIQASAAESGVCISAEAQKALSDCPAGAIQTSGLSKKADVSFKAPPPVSLKKEGIDDTKPTNPSDATNAAQRDERKQKMEKKSRQLLVTEIQNLESLFTDTKKNSSDRPKLARRLAEAYVELESAAQRDQAEADVRADDAKRKGDSKGASDAQADSKTAKQVLDAARKSSIKYYNLLKNDYPNYCQQPNDADPSKSQGCGDEVLYYLAYEYEQGKEYDKARNVYLELIKNWPKSKFIPNAYFAFGELFFQDAQQDPGKWAFAEQSYQEVIKYPPPDNKLFGAAHYKLGYVYWNQGDYAKAMTSFKNVIEYSGSYSTLPNAPQLGNNARRDIIPVYALSGDPKKAYGFLHPLSGDTGSSNEKTYKMMDDLGLNYLDTGHYQEGIDLYSDLMSKDKGEKWCDYQGHITEATLALKSGDKDGAMKQLDRQVEVYKEFQKGNASAQAKSKCGNTTVDLEAETAMSWHLEAVGTNGVKGTSDAKTMKLAADLYENITSTFSANDFQNFTFPRIIKEDWPTLMKIKYSMADLLYFQKDWKRCGPAFDAVVAEDPKGPQAPEAAFASVLCYQNIYAEAHKDGADRRGSGNLPTGDDGKDKGAKPTDAAKFAPKPFDDNQKGMLTAFNRYVCYIKPDNSSTKEAKTQYAEVKFARARTYFENQHWEEAALGFRDIALNYPDEEVGIFASQLYLESVNVLGSHSDPARPQCFVDMANDVPEFHKLYCEAKRSQNADQCVILDRIQRDIERLAAEKIFEAANAHPDTPEGMEQFRQAGQRYMDLWEKYGKEPCEANNKEGCARNDEVLANAAESFQHARLIMKAVTIRKTLIDPKYHLNETELAKKAVYKIGANYQAIAVYDEAASWFERFASESPGMDDTATKVSASTALSDATVLRLGLGQEDQAIKDADNFNKNYGAKKPAEAAQVAFAIGAHYAQKEDWDNARKRLSGALGQIDKNATLDVQIQAHALMGQIYSKIGNSQSARTEYDKVRGMWSNPDEMVKKLRAIGGDSEGEDVKGRRIGKALTAVGEAFFFFAEEKRAIAEKIQFPEYKGSGERDDVQNFIKTKVTDWITKKKPAIAEAEKEYKKIVDLQPAPPPRWVIAAGSRVGEMKGKFVAQFRAAPIPKEWHQNGPSGIPDLNWEDIRGAYFDALDSASEPIKQEAKGAFQLCLKYSVDFQYFDDYSRYCEKWLSDNYPSEYHLIDEFRGAPNRVGSGLQERPQALNPDMTPVIDAPAVTDQPKPSDKPADKPADKPSAATTTTPPATNNKPVDPLSNAHR
ncbi:MAG: tetratricopeptide repeat protein [Polyangiaceae bacterium]